ncbi:MAG: 16S rRNA (cytidine(1402)-2'-O)-methyltransferase [Deltaproteobacteria bacterium]|nr:16S rRNA (cytidine(1402)-2'-O)-methyltransferase [Deltaproteobacteria bacterium]MCB9786832.1 16S rRNA (cytidine(1402)-2'-O)-methyltransferase [Deltaproteobacteria bacterium]
MAGQPAPPGASDDAAPGSPEREETGGPSPGGRAPVEGGSLYVVATPIGNLEDITWRAARVLSAVDHIACEDTRVTGRLCAHLGVARPLLRHEAHNEAASTAGILALLARGEAVALVSDAGTPGISDPGARLCEAAAAAGHPVVPVPGPSALLAALSASGLPSDGFCFHGFLPKRPAERRARFEALAPGTHAFFCPARDLSRVVDELARCLPEARLVIARELTKLHEQWYRGVARELASQMDADSARGEAVVLLHHAPVEREVTDAELLAALREARAAGTRTRDAATAVAARLGVAKRRAYALAITLADDG